MCSKTTRFDGKVIIVTGSSSGIGAAAAIMFAERGGSVAIHGRRQDKLDEVAAKIESVSGRKPVSVTGDITCEKDRETLVNETLKAFGRIDVLVNNAGTCEPSGWQTDIKLLQPVLDLHVIAPLDLSQRCMPELLKNKGNIVMISSIGGLMAPRGYLHYSIAKGGMQTMMRTLAAEVAKLGVRVNAVNPGYIETDILRDEELKKRIAANPNFTATFNPNGIAGKPDDVAEAICFLSSDAARMITGSTNTVDGGKTAFLQF
ncbi:uncharacterized protein LOC100898643 [Galendromus occidentalis]|uniref:Uncharacterized protein LOC100898643 n=1 Tax=Galendromus occidentalis TaxID=34638 RepID=A0AAJ6VXE3_9ACAR|nr:uncharacterized protein LOC100898643 [Galendromus occidentalis]